MNELGSSFGSDGSIHYICMDWRHAGEALGAADGVYSELKNLIVWVKDNGGMGNVLPLPPRADLCLQVRHEAAHQHV